VRKALVVGIDFYEHASALYGCVNDAHNIKAVLERNGDGTKNFGVQMLSGTGPNRPVNRRDLRDAASELFSSNDEIALFYFAGHGFVDDIGGYLVASNTEDGNDGIPLSDIIQMANESPAQNKLIMLDSCHSGIAGNRNAKDSHVTLNTGVTILTASSQTQYAMEEDGSGLFTTLLVDALNGGASDLMGYITPGAVYAHIDQSLGEWDQRPLFKTNVSSFSSLRRVSAPIDLSVLRKICDYFPNPADDHQLDPDYEPDSPTPDKAKNEILADLQEMVKVNLVRPNGETHMYYAAMNSKSCGLTLLGEHYWKLVNKGQI
jgi:hypothetical protein